MKLPAASAATVELRLRGDRIVLDVLEDASPAGRMTLEAGSLQRILSQLEHEPPSAGDLESAIAVIEDELMPVLRLLPVPRQLMTSAPLLREVAVAAGLGDTAEADLDTATVESLFNRLADVAHGMPAARLGIPTGRTFAAALLLLRELLHHGGFDSVRVVKAAPGA